MDAGDGWFDLPLPPAKLAVHPAEEGGWAELYPAVPRRRRHGDRSAGRGIDVARPVSDQSWGLLRPSRSPSGSSSASISPATRPRPSRVERTTVRGHPGRQHQRVCVPGARVRKQVITRDGRVGQWPVVRGCDGARCTRRLSLALGRRRAAGAGQRLSSACWPQRAVRRLVSRASAPEFGELLGKGSALVEAGSSGGRPRRQIHQIAAESVAGVAIRQDGFDSAAAGA